MYDPPGSANRAPDLLLPGLRPLHAALERLSYPLIRIAAGAFLIPHGGQKLFGWFGGDPARIAAQFERIGLAPGNLWVTIVGLVEVFGGLLIAVGLLTRPAALAATVLLLVATKVHAPIGWFWTDRGMEFPLLWALLCLAIAIRGGGDLSVDRAIGKEV